MNEKCSNITLSYDRENKHMGKLIFKEIKKFVNKYNKLLALDKQKEIEINIIRSDKISISVTNRLINVKVINKMNVDELITMIKNKIISILEKDGMLVPSYIKDQINGSFDLTNTIKLNKLETKKILEELNKSK